MADFGLQEMLFWVKQKKAEELDEILKVIVLRNSELLPEQELVCMFLPKNAPEKRKWILSQIEFFCSPEVEQN